MEIGQVFLQAAFPVQRSHYSMIGWRSIAVPNLPIFLYHNLGFVSEFIISRFGDFLEGSKK
jgi:hypothetical protein